MALDKIYGP
jgi:hypothetical protein